MSTQSKQYFRDVLVNCQVEENQKDFGKIIGIR